MGPVIGVSHSFSFCFVLCFQCEYPKLKREDICKVLRTSIFKDSLTISWQWLMQPLITNQVTYPLPKCIQELWPCLLIFDCQLVNYYKIRWYSQVKEKDSLSLCFTLQSTNQIIKQDRSISNFWKIENILCEKPAHQCIVRWKWTLT